MSWLGGILVVCGGFGGFVVDSVGVVMVFFINWFLVLVCYVMAFTGAVWFYTFVLIMVVW